MSTRRRKPRDEIAIARHLDGLRRDVAALPPERRAALTHTLERAAVREEKPNMPTKKPTTAGKRKASGSPPPTAIRLAPEILAAIDRAGEKMAADMPGMTVTRTDAIRVLLVEALAVRKIPIK